MTHTKQKFHKGDLVRIAKDLGPSMSHFPSDCDALILYSYAEEYGGYDTTSYAVFVKDRGFSAWYHEPQLSLLERGCHGLLEQWEQQEKDEEEQKSDLDWIFEHGPELLSGEVHGASIGALTECLGMTDLWGPRGEGFVYMQNALAVLAIASPFLASKDKEGWLAFAASKRRIT